MYQIYKHFLTVNIKLNINVRENINYCGMIETEEGN